MAKDRKKELERLKKMYQQGDEGNSPDSESSSQESQSSSNSSAKTTTAGKHDLVKRDLVLLTIIAGTSLVLLFAFNYLGQTTAFGDFVLAFARTIF